MKRKGEAAEVEEVEKKKLKKNKKAKKKENTQPTEKGDNMESSFTSPEKKKKKKKPEKEKIKKQKKESESSQEEDKVPENSHKDKNNGSSQEEDAASTCWLEDDIKALLESIDNMEEHADATFNKVPPEVWSSLRVGNHSPESCHTTWNKICHVVKTHLTIHHIVMVTKDMLHSKNNKKILKLLVSKFPGAPPVKIVSAYQCFSKEKLAETPPRSFKDIGVEWKALTDSERSRYQEKADKANKETKKKQEEFIQGLSEEMREKYLEQTKGKGQKKSGKSISPKEFADAPRSTLSNSYQEYTKERYAEDRNVTFTEIAASWKNMSDAQKKPYQVRAVKINDEAKKVFEKYVNSLTDEEQLRFFKSRKLTEKHKIRVKKEQKPKGLSQRDFKKAELQYLKEEEKIAIKENPDLEEEEVLKRLSEAFRSLDYETQKSYCRKAEISLQEQKKITEFYKNFESPLTKKRLTSSGTPPSSRVKGSQKKADPSSSGSSESSDSEDEKKMQRQPPVMALEKKAETESDSSSEEEAKPQVQSPLKRKKKKKTSDSDSSSSSSNKKGLKPSPKKVISSRKKLTKVGNVTKESSSSDNDSSSDDEPKTTGRQTGPSSKKISAVKKPESSSSGSSSSEEEATKTQRKPLAQSSPTKKPASNIKMVGISSPKKPSAVKKPESSTSESSSSEDEANKTQKKPLARSSPTKQTASRLKTPIKSPNKLVNAAGKQKSEDDSNSDLSDVLPLTQSNSPKKSVKKPPPPSPSSSDLSSSDSSSESDDGNKGSQKPFGLTKTPQQTLKTSLNTPMKSISSLKTLKKKQK